MPHVIRHSEFLTIKTMVPPWTTKRKNYTKIKVKLACIVKLNKLIVDFLIIKFQKRSLKQNLSHFFVVPDLLDT